MNSSSVSIIIPAYNAANYIRDCLQSIQKQSFVNLQIIVINDGSVDNTSAIVAEIAESDERVLLINQENKGCSAAKNKGLEYVKGAFVQYVDADDILSEDKIEKQVYSLLNNKECIAVCKTIVFKNFIDDTNLEIDTDLISKGGEGKEFLLRLWGSEGRIGMVQPNAYLLPVEIVKKIGNWDESLSPSPDEDGEYFARAIISCNKVIFTEGINFYRKLPNEWSLSKAKTFEHTLGLFKTIKKKFEPLMNNNHGDEFKKYYNIQLTNCAYQFGNQYPAILTLIEEEFKNQNITGFNVIGNNKFDKVARIIGFRNAMKLKKFIGY